VRTLTRIHRVGRSACLALLAGAVLVAQTQTPTWPREPENPSAPKPADVPQTVAAFIGEYQNDSGAHLYLLERDGKFWTIIDRGEPQQLSHLSALASADGSARAITLPSGTYRRLQVGPEGGGQLHVTPVRPVAEVLKESLSTPQPIQTGDFKAPDLVELTKLDPTIKLDIRYATTNNFLGAIFYAEARAFLQRPAADAVVRVVQALKPLGYGLLIHDGYRPWYVTRTFWECTPEDKHWLVANPASGSKHNRGAAVDLTLYDLKTGAVIEMPSTYDESTPRAYAFYPGGTSLQRWHRALLRRLMEAEGFTVNPEEWWHFDYKDWQNYAVANVTFDKIK